MALPTLRRFAYSRFAAVFVLIIFSFFSAQLFANSDVAYQRGILALYKSSENQTEGENEIFWYLSNILREMGFTIEYWDIDRGVPDTRRTQNARAIITWFRGPTMQNAVAYLDFIDKAIEAGKKLVVIENFGAYQDRRTQEYVDIGRLNNTLSSLGIIYQGDWTDDHSKIRIASKVAGMVEHQAQQDVARSSFFYRFGRVDRDLKVYLALKRSDRRYDASPVIVSNANGGFALSTYVYSQTAGKVNLLLDLKSFLEEALFPGPSAERIALLHDAGNLQAQVILGLAADVLERGKLPFEMIASDQFANLLPGDLNRFTAVGLILGSDKGLSPTLLEQYLERGNGIVSLMGGKFDGLAELLALDKSDPVRSSALRKAKGFRFRFGFLLGEGLSLENNKLTWTSGANSPTRDSETLATSFNGRTPILWSARRNSGKVLVWNWDAFRSGGFQGLMLESFLYLRPVGIAATPGIGVMFIDDWPLPMYNIVKPPLSITDTKFYTQTWWPEIKNLFKQKGLPFSCYLVFNYNSTTSPPFSNNEFYVADNMASVKIARGILRDGIELGLHGYNHISLTSKETAINIETWPSATSIESALSQARREWISLFGRHTLPVSYVAPHNVISQEAIGVLHSVLPSIQSLSMLRSGTDEETYTVFGRHPALPELYYLPRTSSGYPFTNEVRQLTVAAITGAGIWSHFIHAVDVFDPHRSLGKEWPELKSDLTRMIDFVQHHYPWLEHFNTRDASRFLRKFDATGVEIRQDSNTVHIDSSPGIKFRLRLNQSEVKSLQGAKIIYRYSKMNAVVLEITEPHARINITAKN